MSVRVRPAGVADRAFIERLGKRSVMDSVSASRRAEPARVLTSFERLLHIVERQSHLTLVADDEGTPCGFLMLLDDLPDEVTGEEQGFIAYMAVEPDYRKAGLGALLLQHAEDEARGRGLPYMTLMVTEDNAPARALYDRAGYRTERRLLCKTL